MYSYPQNPQDVAISEITSNISLSKILLIVIMAIVGLDAIWNVYLIILFGTMSSFLLNIGISVVAIIIQLFLLNKINEAENYAKMRNLLPLNNILNDMTVIVLSFIFGVIIVGFILYLAKEKVNSLVQMPQGSMQQYPPPAYPQPQYAPGVGAMPYPSQYPPTAMPSQPIIPQSTYPPQYPQQPATIYCQSCSKPIPSNSTRCPYCGYPVYKM